MYKFYPEIVSTRISALVDNFGVVYSGLWTTVWYTAVYKYKFQFMSDVESIVLLM